ncbi:MAG: hypothetical protein NE330_19040 [Lentisphaeraceae bacterium]|nr:hypothetical protein [Lentisphaeraceae bacterium]
MINRFLLTLALLLTSTIYADDNGFFITAGGPDTKKNGKTIESEFGTILTTKDFEKWDLRFKGGPVKDKFTHANSNIVRCIAYGNGVFVAVGNAPCIYLSKDGVSWETIPMVNAMSVNFGNGKFLACNTKQFMTSTDGRNWKIVEQDTTGFKVWDKGKGAQHVRKTIFGNGVFLVYGQQRLGVTKDCKTFLHHRLFTNKSNAKSIITFGNGHFVWVHPEKGNQISTDGINWQPLVIDSEVKQDSLLWTGNEFIAGGSGFIYHSKNGKEWTKTKTNMKKFTLSAYGNGQLVSFYSWKGGATSTISRDLGKTWEKTKWQEKNMLFRLYYFNGETLIGNNGG